MKRKFFVLLCMSVFLLTFWEIALADVTINETNFPDENFRNYVLSADTSIDKNQDGVLSDAEIAVTTEIYVYDMNIVSLQGIEYFTALTYLGCSDNQLTTLDVSNNTALTGLECSSNQLTELDLSNNPNLVVLKCDNNNFTELDCSHGRVMILDMDDTLTTLSVANQSLYALDLSNYSSLTNAELSPQTIRSSNIFTYTSDDSLPYK